MIDFNAGRVRNRLRKLSILAFFVLPLSPGGPAEHRPNPPRSMKFLIHGDGVGPIADVEVLRGGPDGLKHLALSDRSGIATVPLGEIRPEKVYVIVFCHDYYFCGAFRTDVSDFYDYEERYIVLKPLTLLE